MLDRCGPRTGFVEGGVPLWFEDRGSLQHPPVVLIAGQGGDSTVWDAGIVGPLIENGYRVLTFDNRDCGLSGDTNDPNYTVVDLGADTIRLLDALEIEAAHLVGQSMGGMVAQQLAIASPERVRSLTLVSTSSDLSIASPDREFARFVAEADKASVSGFVETAVEAARRQSGSRIPFDEEVVRSHVRLIVDRAFRPDAWTRQLFAVFRSPPRTEALRRVLISTLIVHGTEDPLLPIAHAEVLAKTLPNARLARVTGWTHMFPWGHWEIILEPLLPHLASCERNRGTTSGR